MAETQKPVVKPLWLAIPITLHAQMARAGLDPATRDLNVGAWSFVAMHQTDGRLTGAEANRMFSSNHRRRSALVEAGYWRRIESGDYEVVGYLDLNRTKTDIEERRAGHRARQSKYEKGHRKTPQPFAGRTPDTPDD